MPLQPDGLRVPPVLFAFFGLVFSLAGLMSNCCACDSVVNDSEVPVENTGAWMRMVFAALVAAQSMIFGLAIAMTPPEGSARWILHGILAASAVLVFVLVGGPVLRSAIDAARRRTIVIEQLFLAGIAGAFFASLHCTLTGTGDVYYEVVAILLAIYTFGKLIGDQRREEAMRAARDLGAEFEEAEKITADGTQVRVEVSEIRAGDLVRVTAGGAIPVDGVVVSGVAFVRESAITGESFPVVKREGDAVTAGSFSMDRSLEVRAASDGTRRVLDRLIESVRMAQASKSRLQLEADRLVAWFLPSVLVISLTVFAAWCWVAGWQIALFHALAVLVVACPCSMGLATPIGIWASLSSLARRGIISRNSEIVEQLARVDAVVFDKTGTLGEERLNLVDFVTVHGVPREELLAEVGAVEATSHHPVAMGFRGHGALNASVLRPLPGVGIAGTVNGHQLEIGNRHLVDPEDPSAVELTAKLEADRGGSHEVWVKRDGVVAGLGILRERLRESATPALQTLKGMGISTFVMTGDRAAAASAHGLENVLPELQPHQKAERVRALRREGRRVLFVGDGINDAPAMAEADAAISIGGGSPLAGETADAELATTNLEAIPSAIIRCRRMLHAVRRNLLFAAAYNVIGITLAAAGLIHPVTAALLMLASSFTVTWQALRETKDLEIAAPAAKPRKVRRTAATMPVFVPSWAKAALVGGVLLQGPALAYLGGFPPSIAVGIVLLFLGVACLLGALLRLRPLATASGMALSMFSLGGLFMLVGWWADAGFAAVVRDGVCLCGCPDSGLGWGIFFQPNWMAVGMLAAAFPTLYFERLGKGARRLMCWGAGVVGMFVGMELGAIGMALVPVIAETAGLHFFATYGAMVLGMSLGMLLTCESLRRLLGRQADKIPAWEKERPVGS